MSILGKVRFSKISVLVCQRFCLAKSFFVASSLVKLSLLVICGFGKFYFQSLPKIKFCIKLGLVGGGVFFLPSFW